jgi:hypothetical protein
VTIGMSKRQLQRRPNTVARLQGATFLALDIAMPIKSILSGVLFVSVYVKYSLSAAVWLVARAALKALAKSASSCALSGSPPVCLSTPAGMLDDALRLRAASSLSAVSIAPGAE